jgi:hypothetical protein
MLHGRAHKVEAQLNDLAAAGWQFVALASGADGLGAFLFFTFGATVTILLRRERTRT